MEGERGPPVRLDDQFARTLEFQTKVGDSSVEE